MIREFNGALFVFGQTGQTGMRIGTDFSHASSRVTFETIYE